jgi:hypothetical protein
VKSQVLVTSQALRNSPPMMKFAQDRISRRLRIVTRKPGGAKPPQALAARRSGERKGERAASADRRGEFRRYSGGDALQGRQQALRSPEHANEPPPRGRKRGASPARLPRYDAEATRYAILSELHHRRRIAKRL